MNILNLFFRTDNTDVFSVSPVKNILSRNLASKNSTLKFSICQAHHTHEDEVENSGLQIRRLHSNIKKQFSINVDFLKCKSVHKDSRLQVNVDTHRYTKHTHTQHLKIK